MSRKRVCLYMRVLCEVERFAVGYPDFMTKPQSQCRILKLQSIKNCLPVAARDCIILSLCGAVCNLDNHLTKMQNLQYIENLRKII